MKKRILGAILILVIGIPLILLGGRLYILSCGLLGALALKELLDLKEHHHPIPDFIFFISVVDLLLFLFSPVELDTVYLNLPYKYFLFTILTLYLPTLFYRKKTYTMQDAFYVFGSIVFVALAFYSLLFIRFYDLNILLYLIFISIFTDTFALFVGKLIGKHKCSPTISPGKTWEGCIGGSICGVSLSLIFYFLFIGRENVCLVILMTILLSCIGQLGDLVFSKIKRENKIKDFSHLIPGHGGILDRFDSLLFITMAYILFIGLV